MSVRHLLAASTVDAHTLTGDRLVATAAVLVTLAGAIIGGLVLFRPVGRYRRRGPTVAVVAGMTGMVVGVLVVATADGGPGTGNGIVGGYVAVGIGLIAAILGGLALVAARRSPSL